MKKNLVILVIISQFFASCSLLNSYIDSINAYYKFKDGSYDEALLVYFKLKENEYFESILDYNIATIYQAFGESPSALEEFDKIDISLETDPEFLHSYYFNMGVVYYSLGDYKKSKENFIMALKYKRGDKATKENLEIVNQKLKSSIMQDYNEDYSELQEYIEEEDFSVIKTKDEILDYVKKREEIVWFSNDYSEEKKDPHKKYW